VPQRRAHPVTGASVSEGYHGADTQSATSPEL
jgi:hypothetical protein